MTVKKPKTALKKRGRNPLYSEKLASQIIELIEKGVSEAKIGKMAGMPDARTILRWKDKYPEFCRRSARARKVSAGTFREEALNVARDVSQLADTVVQNIISESSPLVELPKGYVEAKKLYIQELNREAALRDDENFGDRKKVDVSTNAPIQVVFKDDLED